LGDFSGPALQLPFYGVLKRSDGSAKVNQAVTATIDSCLFIYLFTCCETNAFV